MKYFKLIKFKMATTNFFFIYKEKKKKKLTYSDKCTGKHELRIPKLSGEFHSPFSPEIIGVEKHKCII